MSTKLTSCVLEFQNPPQSTKGVQITVRNGPKWSKRVTPGMIVDAGPPAFDGRYEDLTEVKIVGVLITTFAALTDEIIEYDQDPKCRTREGLLAEMKRVYPSFEETNLVTVLFFEFVKVATE